MSKKKKPAPVDAGADTNIAAKTTAAKKPLNNINPLRSTSDAERLGLFQQETRYNAVDGTTHDTPEAAAHATIQHNMKHQLREALIVHRELDIDLIDGVLEVLSRMDLTTLREIIDNAYVLTAKHASEFLKAN